MRALALVLVLALAPAAMACGGGGGSSPRPAPSPTAPTPPPVQTWAVTGSLADSATGQPVAGGSVTLDNRPPVSSDASGRWRVEGTGVAPAVLAATLAASGFVTRETFIAAQPTGRQDVPLDVIAERAPFSLAFYRQLVRNGFESPDDLEPLRRWRTNPSFYINRYNPRTERLLLASEVDLMSNALRQSVPQLTGGLFSVGVIEVGDGPRDPRPGFIGIEIVYEPKENYCGRAFVGADPGKITINYDRCRNSCGNEFISPAVIAHEVGHALGFWHVPDGIMKATIGQCFELRFSDAERTHAAIAYKRPNGNMDPDKDPAGYQAVTTGGAPQVTCPAAAPAR